MAVRHNVIGASLAIEMMSLKLLWLQGLISMELL